MKGSQAILILLIAIIIGYLIGKQFGKTKEEKEDNAVLGSLVMSIVGLLIIYKSDTVNYVLKKGGKTVYHGITYFERFSQRMKEHARNGKDFDSATYGASKPRAWALDIEKTRILRDRPVLNFQHNR